MLNRMTRLAATALVFLLLTLVTSVNSGNWHVGPSLNCADCHLQHSSEDAQPVSGGPFSTLLLKNTVNELCLSCHDGSDPAAPDVLNPVGMYSGESPGESAAGFLDGIGLLNARGHDLAVSAATPLSTFSSARDLHCGHCHNVHGNANYRNLLADPAESGDTIIIEEGIQVFTQVRPDVPPAISASIAAYSRSNVGYKENLTQWCVSCHDRLATNLSASAEAHFMAHPSDVALNSGGLDAHADAQHWVAGTGEGFPSASNPGEGIHRLPHLSPTATDHASATTAAETDRVFCMSCHKAHGGAYQSSLLWPNEEGGSNFIAGCQQCHNQ